MRGRAASLLGLWLLAMLVGGWIVARSHFTADMSFFLPARPTPGQQVLVDQLKEGVVSRLLMIGIEGGSAERRAKASRDLRAALLATGDFVSIQNGETDSQSADQAWLVANRYLLSPAVNAERFTVDGLRDAISESVDLLSSPAGMMLKTLLPRDPTGEFWALIEGLNPGGEPNRLAGVWASRDGQRAMLLLQTRALGSDTEAQAAAIERVRTTFNNVASGEGADALRLQLSGPGVFAVKARETVREDIRRLTLISTVAIVVLLFFVFRSPRLLLLGLLPVLSGAMAGVVAVSLVYGTVYGITVGFGSALIGEAVDYSIYYLVQAGKDRSAQWRERFWPTIRLGVLTSVAGFGTLLLSGFPGLAQLGLYALAGVGTAALITRFLLPALAAQHAEVRDLDPLGRKLATAAQGLSRLRWPVIVLALVAALYLYQQRDRLWHPDLSVLSTVSAEDAAVDMALRADLSAPDARYLVVISAPDQEQALLGAERAGTRLDTLVAEGRLGGYDTPVRFLPSQTVQRARQAALPDEATLRAALPLAIRDLPVSPGRLSPFIEEVAAARQQPLISRAALAGTGPGLLVDSLLMERDGRWSVLLPLRPPPESQALDTAAVRAALAGTDALFIDMKGEFDQLYADYLKEAMLLALLGLVAILCLLAFALRAVRRLLSVMLPLALAVILVIAGLHGLGQPLHLLHLIGMLLIVAVGSNYALFFDRQPGQSGPAPSTLASMAVANVTTVIGFGTLGLSAVPVLQAIGVTVGPGTALALLLSAIFASRETTT